MWQGNGKIQMLYVFPAEQYAALMKTEHKCAKP